MKQPHDMTGTPPGGWRFTDPLTGQHVMHPHPTAFLQEVARRRRANDIVLTGGWEAVVMDQVCEQNPEIPCVDAEMPDIPMTADEMHRFLTTIAEFKGAELVSDEEHIRRANICLRCPLKAHVNCKFCGWAAKKITELLGGRKLHRVAELHKLGCGACKCNLDTKTYYPLDVLKVVDQKLGKQPEYWSECWMRE